MGIDVLVVVVVGSVEVLVDTSLLLTSVASIKVTAGIASLTFLTSIAVVHCSINYGFLDSFMANICLLNLIINVIILYLL